ncbi:hypothetical protein [Pseudoalteromonas rhizosphaerae]|uniref:hypothetical protein n=1 Tax=Pseudoalteromonas rhizosphaerae TaxID=2518973 RepID=UPI00237F1A30|nr:hypothetical protein [Pseudoalteromonas rhizosphaerae]
MDIFEESLQSIKKHLDKVSVEEFQEEALKHARFSGVSAADVIGYSDNNNLVIEHYDIVFQSQQAVGINFKGTGPKFMLFGTACNEEQLEKAA